MRLLAKRKTTKHAMKPSALPTYKRTIVVNYGPQFSDKIREKASFKTLGSTFASCIILRIH